MCNSNLPGKKKVDPDFIGSEKSLLEPVSETVILATLEKLPKDIKDEHDESEEMSAPVEDSSDEWEAFTKVFQIYNTSQLVSNV